MLLGCLDEMVSFSWLIILNWSVIFLHLKFCGQNSPLGLTQPGVSLAASTWLSTAPNTWELVSLALISITFFVSSSALGSVPQLSSPGAEAWSFTQGLFMGWAELGSKVVCSSSTTIALRVLPELIDWIPPTARREAAATPTYEMWRCLIAKRCAVSKTVWASSWPGWQKQETTRRSDLHSQHVTKSHGNVSKASVNKEIKH